MRFLIFLLLFNSYCYAQDPDYIYDDVVYYDDIHTVNIYAAGFPTSPPLFALNSAGKITLEFDDLAADVKNYTYEIIHCTPDWKKSDLDVSEYLDGFETEEIENYSFSRNTYIPYTHYNLTFPNDETSLKLSGNYILIVFDEDDDHDPILMRRFMVYEDKVDVSAKLVTTFDVSKLNSHHELRFDIDLQGFKVGNPMAEITTTVLQNYQWQSAFINVKPNLLGLNKVTYNMPDSIVFPGIKEYRSFDIRSLNYESNYIQEISQDIDKGYSVLLYTDQRWYFKPYVFTKDLNGNYLIGMRDKFDNFANNGPIFIENYNSKSLFADYAKVVFSLESSEFIDKDLYVYGALTDWKLDEDFKMAYDKKLGIYALEAKLKQGYYNYQYVLKDKLTGKVDYTTLDGSSYDAEDDYLFLVYYKPFGERYTRLIGRLNFNSLRWRISTN